MKLFALLACAACATPASLEPRANQTKRAPADPYADHIAALRTRLAKSGLANMQIRVEDPFVVVGNGSEQDLAQDASTVRWAVQHLEADFFDARPAKMLDVYLFRDADS